MTPETPPRRGDEGSGADDTEVLEQVPGDPAGEEPADVTKDADAESAEAEYGPDDGDAKQTVLRGVLEWVAILGVALLAAVVIRQFLLQAFYIPSASMEHTLEIRDRVLVNKLSYRLHAVRRGDILVFKPPASDGGGERDLIKRAVGLPGDTVEGRDGAVFVNGKRLDEPYLAKGVTSSSFAPQQVPPGHVWMMGDNRANSRDSRAFGPVPKQNVVGRAFIRVFPLDSIKLL